jgi:Ca2+/H+ antiporter
MQKNKKYWLRGGIIGIIFPIAIALLIWFLAWSTHSDWNLTSIFFGSVQSIFIYIFHVDDVFNDYSGVIAKGIGTFILDTIITYAIIGIFLGWLYGKFKRNNA